MCTVDFHHALKLRLITSLALALVLLGLVVPVAAPVARAADGPGPFTSLDAALKAGFIQAQSVQAAMQEGAAPVIVQLRLSAPFKPEGSLDYKSVGAQRQTIQAAQDAVLKKLVGLRTANIKKFQTIPHLALQADTTTLVALVGMSEVRNIAVDHQMAPALDHSVPLIGADKVRRAESDSAGSGQSVAILDTGVDGTHPFLSPRIVAEACFSTGAQLGFLNPDPDFISLCPNGDDAVIAPGSAAPSPFTGCEHGTHLAGIAAGRGSSFNGVAPEANIVAIKVFHGDDDSDHCRAAGETSNPCLLAFDSDVVQGLERVSLWRSSLSIAAVNLSMSWGSYTSQAACDSDFSSVKDAIDNLRSFGVATVAASGDHAMNGSVFAPGVGAPACISSAVSVGSTTTMDTVSSFSQSAGFLNLLAPGEGIDSSVPAGSICPLVSPGFCRLSGTSMAAAHVTGSWAMLKALSPGASVNTILNALTSTGRLITDNRAGAAQSTPRIQVDAAAEAILGAPLPPRQLQTSTIAGTSVGLSWVNDARSATSVSLEVKRTSDTTWLPGATVLANQTTGTVRSLIPNTSYDFRVAACTQVSCSTPSNSVTVSTLDTLPSRPTNLRTGAITNDSVEVQWDSSSIHPITYFKMTSDVGTYLIDSSMAAFQSHDYTVVGLGPSRYFWAQISACNTDGCSRLSNVIRVTTLSVVPVPAAPSDLHVCRLMVFPNQNCPSGGVTLDWTDNSTDATSIDFQWIHAGLGSSPFAGPWNDTTLAGNATRYQLPSVTAGSLYYFQARACNAGGCSQYSNLLPYTAGM